MQVTIYKSWDLDLQQFPKQSQSHFIKQGNVNFPQILTQWSFQIASII